MASNDILESCCVTPANVVLQPRVKLRGELRPYGMVSDIKAVMVGAILKWKADELLCIALPIVAPMSKMRGPFHHLANYGWLASTWARRLFRMCMSWKRFFKLELLGYNTTMITRRAESQGVRERSRY